MCLATIDPANFKLSDLLGVAGATIGIIIAAGILLQFLSTKYVAVYERYRSLTGEYRGNHFSDPRKGSLQDQIACHRRQVKCLSSASLLVAGAIIFFLFTVGVASASVIYPDLLVLRTAGTSTLFLGLSMIGVGITLEMVDLVLQWQSVGKEVSDFSDIPTTAEALSR
jgi:hypothetical protein